MFLDAAQFVFEFMNCTGCNLKYTTPLRLRLSLLFSQLMCYCVESCVQTHIQAQVPQMLEPGYVVSQGTLFSDCLYFKHNWQ